MFFNDSSMENEDFSIENGASAGFAMPGTEVIVMNIVTKKPVGPARDPLHPTEAEQGIFDNSWLLLLKT